MVSHEDTRPGQGNKSMSAALTWNCVPSTLTMELLQGRRSRLQPDSILNLRFASFSGWIMVLRTLARPR